MTGQQRRGMRARTEVLRLRISHSPWRSEPTHSRLASPFDRTSLGSATPIEEFEARGPVFRLVRDPPEAEEGEITIAGLVDGVTRNIWVQLRGDDYRTVVEAHKQHLYVSAIGILRKEGRSWRLAEPRRLRMLAEDDE